MNTDGKWHTVSARMPSCKCLLEFPAHVVTREMENGDNATDNFTNRGFHLLKSAVIEVTYMVVYVC